jgi:hypothetical protein
MRHPLLCDEQISAAVIFCIASDWFPFCYYVYPPFPSLYALLSIFKKNRGPVSRKFINEYRLGLVVLQVGETGTRRAIGDSAADIPRMARTGIPSLCLLGALEHICLPALGAIKSAENLAHEELSWGLRVSDDKT